MSTIKIKIKSTIETKFDKHCNKVSIFETVKEVDEEKIIKEHIISLSRDKTTSLQYDNVEVLYGINNLLIIELWVTKNWDIGQFKGDNFYLLNNMKDKFQDQLIEKVMDDDNNEGENVYEFLLLTA